MKKTSLISIILFLSAAVGALTAAWLYIRRREKELDEYEQLLFSENLDEDDFTQEPDTAEPAAPEAAAPETAE